MNLNNINYYLKTHNSKNILKKNIDKKNFVCSVIQMDKGYELIIHSVFQVVVKVKVFGANIFYSDFKIENDHFCLIKTNDKYYFESDVIPEFEIQPIIFHADYSLVAFNNSAYIDFFNNYSGKIIGINLNGDVFAIKDNWIIKIDLISGDYIANVLEDMTNTNFESVNIRYCFLRYHYFLIEDTLYVYNDDFLLLSTYVLGDGILNFDVSDNNRILIIKDGVVEEYVLIEGNVYLIDSHNINCTKARYVNENASWIVCVQENRVFVYNLVFKQTKIFTHFKYDSNLEPFEFQFYNLVNIIDAVALSNGIVVDKIYAIEGGRREVNFDTCSIVELSYVEEDEVCP